MEKLPFTPQGLCNMTSLIFSLTDAELLVESASLRQNLRLWLRNHFVLNNVQAQFLDSISDTFIDMVAAECEHVMNHRWNIIVTNDERPNDEELVKRGIMLCVNRTSAEELVISITYPLIKQS